MGLHDYEMQYREFGEAVWETDRPCLPAGSVAHFPAGWCNPITDRKIARLTARLTARLSFHIILPAPLFIRINLRETVSPGSGKERSTMEKKNEQAGKNNEAMELTQEQLDQVSGGAVPEIMGFRSDDDPPEDRDGPWRYM